MTIQNISVFCKCILHLQTHLFSISYIKKFACN
nr:MAG TPA: hypothetical protein [Caudoviricetes sp.]